MSRLAATGRCWLGRTGATEQRGGGRRAAQHRPGIMCATTSAAAAGSFYLSTAQPQLQPLQGPDSSSLLMAARKEAVVCSSSGHTRCAPGPLLTGCVAGGRVPGGGQCQVLLQWRPPQHRDHCPRSPGPGRSGHVWTHVFPGVSPASTRWQSPKVSMAKLRNSLPAPHSRTPHDDNTVSPLRCVCLGEAYCKQVHEN